MMQLALAVDSERDRLIADAKAWRDENPAAYGAIVRWAHEDAASGRTCSMQRYFEALRDPKFAAAFFVHRVDSVYLINHNLRSSVTRLVVSENPMLPFRTRHSKCDGPGVGNGGN